MGAARLTSFWRSAARSRPAIVCRRTARAAGRQRQRAPARRRRAPHAQAAAAGSARRPGRKRRDSTATQPSTASSTGTDLRRHRPQRGEHRARGGAELAPGPELVHHQHRLRAPPAPGAGVRAPAATPPAGRRCRPPPAATSRPAPAAPRGCPRASESSMPWPPSIAIEKITVPSTSGEPGAQAARPCDRRATVERRDDEPCRDRPQQHPGDARHQQAEGDRRAPAPRRGGRTAPARSRSDSAGRRRVHVQRVFLPRPWPRRAGRGGRPRPGPRSRTRPRPTGSRRSRSTPPRAPPAAAGSRPRSCRSCPGRRRARSAPRSRTPT